jgi:anti-sigma factor RsiW
VKNCEWREKIGAYVDAELEPAAEQAVARHLQSCTDCSAAILEQQELKKSVRMAGKRFNAPADLYSSVRRQMHQPIGARSLWKWSAIAASFLVLAILGFAWHSRSQIENQTIAQLVDQHVTMLASANPVDVISQDRHTVKPWFQGKVPFTFNLPELNNSDFKLIGGKLIYTQHSPGAELVYQVRQHKVSVFVFQDNAIKASRWENTQVFTVRTWQQGGLQYIVVTDAAKEDADRLRSLLEDANRS